ncbi:testis-specific serine/threonine-protein kinase 3-like isoform X1 [Metopolophium dirhodum]|uniref:testis-specific serine/threonine-protein kinase 3-like isoform X1 n=2 Tax=Metopolophium dirhodum TaxID=44670 RepID=UPI00298FE73B|nr:testis-specific serine/threonine-protein kinase 3-like isoform X1 [Metopolophium dirhodum]XP_060865006.1 testis-specific serine/threonine-protein kinase 3-like isoform X1 [Metopolophium dirhodum]
MSNVVETYNSMLNRVSHVACGIDSRRSMVDSRSRRVTRTQRGLHGRPVQVYSVFQNGYKIYINMEYAENGDMFTYLQKTKLSEVQIRSWLLQILWAFSYMHGVGVVHRDLKCENILLTRRYNLRIADFGFARFVDRGRNPGADTVCGTMTYSSPELLYGKRPYNPVAADVWAIGVVLFIMCNNVPPFRNSHKEEIHRKQMEKHFTFRRSLGRSRTLKDLTTTFLEPNFLKRTKIKTALQHPWIKEGNIKMPADVAMASESIAASVSEPIVTETSLRVPAFHYQLSEYDKSVSTDNELFTAVVEESEVIEPKTLKPKK